MIKIHDHNRRVILLNPASIESIHAAGPGTFPTKSYIRTMSGQDIECMEYVDTIENMIAMDKHQEKKNADT